MSESVSPADDISCRELVELVTEYLDDALSPPERRRFEHHVRGCRSCLDYLAQMRLTIQTTGRLSEDAIPAPALASLLAAFHGWKRG